MIYLQKTRRVLQFKLNQQVRCYSKEICPPPPPKKSGGSGIVYTLGALALAGAATVGYAKYDPEFRKTLADKVPYTDDVIQFVFQEGDSTLLASISSLYEELKKLIARLVGLGEDKSSKKTCPPPPIVDNSEEYKAPPPIIPVIEKDMKKPEETYTEIRLESKDASEVEIVGDVKPKPETLPETHPKNLAELEEKVCASATEAVNAYKKAIHNIKVYNQEIACIIDNAIDEVKPQMWESIKEKTKEKNNSIKLAKQKADEAAKDVAKMKQLISRPGFQADQASKEMIKVKIEKVQDDISDARRQFEMEEKLGSTTEKYWEKVEKARQHFAEELEALFPTIDLSKKKLEIGEADLDLFLLHAYSRVLLYQKELAKLETVSQERLQAAVEAAKKGGGEFLTTAQICEALEQEKRKLAICFQQKCLKLRKEAEAELREKLKGQSQVFSDHLEEAVKTRGLEIERALTRKFDEQLEEERYKYKVQLAAMVGRLQGLDHALKARDDADKTAKQSQVLWSACQALLRAIQTGCPGMPWHQQLRPLEPEITSVKKAAATGDELVETVIDGIPKEAKHRGVFPEDALRERFLKVEEMARRLALVPEEGGALPLYILSYLQAIFLIKSPSPIPQAELNNEEVDFSELTTNEILQRARYWLDRGNFVQTLKYMNLLQGAPRSVARQWIDETRILLETQQAANTLMAHAASSGLMYL